MTVTELTREQMIELKGNYLTAHVYECEGRDLSMNELANADDLVSDELMFKEYEGTDFTADDFFCTAGSEV